jgi:hypothetical protein
MAEAEWLAFADPTPMLEYLRGKVSARKLRLVICTCYQRSGGEPQPTAYRFKEGVVTRDRRQPFRPPPPLPPSVLAWNDRTVPMPFLTPAATTRRC